MLHKDIVIHQQYGLGDHIICNALVRYICATHPQTHFYLAATPTNVPSVSFMYRDLKNLTVERIIEDNPMVLDSIPDHEKFGSNSRFISMPMLKIGREFFYTLKLQNPTLGFDEIFYKQYAYDFSNRWTNFYVDRDFGREEALYNKLNINQKYIFVHHSPERGNIMNFDKIPSYGKLRMIVAAPGMTDNVFDYLKVIENAEEIHCIDSSFIHVVNSFDFRGNLFYHRYSKKDDAKFKLKHSWTEIL